MKKRFSILTVVIVGFLMMAVGVFAGDYVDWDGTPDYEATKNIFGDLRDGIISDKKAKKEVDRLLAVAESTIVEKDNTIGEKNTEINTLKEDLKDSKALVELRDHTIAGLEEKVNNSVDIDELSTVIDSSIIKVNGADGPKHKYDMIKSELDKYKSHLKLTQELGDHGKGTEDLQLEQAIKDMEEIREEAQALKDLLLNERPATGNGQ